MQKIDRKAIFFLLSILQKYVKTYVNVNYTVGYSFSPFRIYTTPLPVVKVEKTFSRVYTKTCGHILIIWQCCTKTNEAHILLSQFHISDSPSNQRLQHWTSVIMKQVDLILHIQKTISGKKNLPACPSLCKSSMIYLQL